MARISPNVLEAVLLASSDPLAAELLGRLRGEGFTTPRAKVTRAFSRLEALRVYRQKAALGDRAGVQTEGYAALLARLSAPREGHVTVHGVTFADAVYLVFTNPGRTELVGVLRKVRLPPEP
jgi:hypothetical protein